MCWSSVGVAGLKGCYECLGSTVTSSKEGAEQKKRKKIWLTELLLAQKVCLQGDTDIISGLRDVCVGFSLLYWQMGVRACET